MTNKTKKIKKKPTYRKKKSGCGNFFILFFLLSLFVFVTAHFFFNGEEQYPRPYAATVNYYCAEEGVDSNLVYAIMKQESGFSADAASPKGATGLMQLMPNTASWAAGKIGVDYDETKLTEPKYNLRLAIWYLNYLSEVFDGDTVKMIAAYNGGENSVKLWLNEGTWNGTLEDASSIPYGETAAYLTAVSENYKKYQEIY